MTLTALPRIGSGRVSETKRLQFHADVREVVVEVTGNRVAPRFLKECSLDVLR